MLFGIYFLPLQINTRLIFFQFADTAAQCLPWQWPMEPVTDSKFEQKIFYEGSFLSMLLDKFSRVLHQVSGIH